MSLTSVGDNLHHASMISLTCMYLRADDERRTKQLAAALSENGR